MVVREALASIDPHVAKAMRNVLDEAGYLVVEALVAAGWGDLSKQRDDILAAIRVMKPDPVDSDEYRYGYLDGRSDAAWAAASISS
jgi:hypothetical protein